MNKQEIIDNIVTALKNEKEIERIIIFGSFFSSSEPNDIDIAVIQSSNESYLALAMKYRKLIRNVAKYIAVDLIPFNTSSTVSSFFRQVLNGKEIYAKGN